jgi:dynein heavy chain
MHAIAFAEHLDEWRVLFDSTSPHLEPLPSEWQARLGPFQRLLLLRALRQDKLTQAISKYVADTMGRCVQGFSLSQLDQVAQHSKLLSPL